MGNTNAAERGLFSEREAAMYMGAQLRDINSLVRRGMLRRLEISPGVIRYARSELDALIASDALVSSSPSATPPRPIDELADRVRQFLAERCVIDIRARVPVAQLAEAFNQWAADDVPGYRFGTALGRASAGIFKIRGRAQSGDRVALYLGVALK